MDLLGCAWKTLKQSVVQFLRYTAEIASGNLIFETAQSVIQRPADFPDESDQVFSILPLELRRALLPPAIVPCSLRPTLGIPYHQPSVDLTEAAMHQLKESKAPERSAIG